MIIHRPIFNSGGLIVEGHIVMIFRKLTLSWLLIAGIICLVGCEGTLQKSYYYSEYESDNYYQSHDPRSDFYDPTGDAAYSYHPMYSPIQRPPSYTPGTPAYQYSYYYSNSQGD